MLSDGEDTGDNPDIYRLEYNTTVDDVISDYEKEIHSNVTDANQRARFQSGNFDRIHTLGTGIHTRIPAATTSKSSGRTVGSRGSGDVMARVPEIRPAQSLAGLPGDEPADCPREFMYKILVVGEFGVGKTSIIKRYTEDVFSPAYKITIGVDFALKVLAWDHRTKVKLQLWDIAGQERFGHMTRVYYKYAVAAIIVFDLTRPRTFDAVLKWLHDVRDKAFISDEEPIPCFILANKCDVDDVEIDTEVVNEFCRNNFIEAWFPTSAKDGANINEAMRYVVQHVLRANGADDSSSSAHSLRALSLNAEPTGNFNSGGKTCCH